MKFGNKFFNQIKGTAMGTIFIPTYATLSIGHFEIKFHYICNLKYGQLLFVDYIKRNWNWFLDVYFTVLRSEQITLDELTLNSINPSMQFTIEYSKNEKPFSDILIKRNENGI